MANPAARIAGALVLLAAGFALGILVGQRRTGAEVSPRPEAASVPAATRSSKDPGALSARAQTDPSTGDTAALRERIGLLEIELETLQKGSDRTSGDSKRRVNADQILEDFLALENGGMQDPDQLRSILDQVSRLDPSCAQTFINRYRNPRDPKSDEKKVAMQLAIWSGGPEAAGFIQLLLNDASLEPSYRDSLLSELGSQGGSLFSVRHLPIDDGLAATAMTMLRSDKAEERRAGAGLLGGVAGPASRLELLRILSEDGDPGVKIVAIRSLSYVGDPATRKTLEPYAAQSTDPTLQKAAAAAIKELDRGPH